MNLYDHLRRCVVKLSIPGKVDYGTGFFAAPGLILTCRHVVEKANNLQIKVSYGKIDEFAYATIDKSLPEKDIALLRINSQQDRIPCVLLDESFEPRDDLYSFGYSSDFLKGGPFTFSTQGLSAGDQQFIIFKAGLVKHGMSGSPLLNLRTYKICGMVKFTLDKNIPLGGGGITVSEILSSFSELIELQKQYHEVDNRWIRYAEKLKENTLQSKLESKTFLKRFNKSYNSAKLIRTKLRAESPITSNINAEINAEIYKENMVYLREVQLEFETLKRESEINTLHLNPSENEELFSNLKSIEKYLNKIVKEYEENYKLSKSNLISIYYLPKMREFISKPAGPKFKKGFKTPKDKILKIFKKI